MRINKHMLLAAITALGAFQQNDFALAADSAPSAPAKAAPANPAPTFPFFYVNDNRVTFAYAPEVGFPGFPGKTAEKTLAFTHLDVWAYGTNFVNIGISKYDQHAPAAPCTVSYQGCAGSVKAAGSIRSTFGFNEIFGTKAFSIGPLRNVAFEVGADGAVGNVTSGLSLYALTAGLQFTFDLPYKGIFNIAPLIYKERIYYGTVSPFGPFKPGIPDGTFDFDPTWAVEANYQMNLGFLPETIPLAISGRMLIVGAQGYGYAAGQLPSTVFPPSATQFITEPIRLTLDASRIIWGKNYSHALDVWVAYKYNQNVLSLDHDLSSACKGGACTTSSVYTGITAKF
jgi:hypothetical protein